MTRKLTEHFLALTLACILTGCMAVQPAIAPGEVLSVSPETVKFGYQLAMQGLPGTARYLSPDLQYVVWSWPCVGGQAWAFLASGEGAVVNFFRGNITGLSTWSELEKYILALGWKVITPAEMTAFLQARALMQNLAIIGTGLSVPILIPASLFDGLDKFTRPQVAA